MNWQHCANVAFVGLSDSWEQYYQAVRRCWRFGQERRVHVHIITTEAEGAVVANIQRKERDAGRMAEALVEHMHTINEENLIGEVASAGVCRVVHDIVGGAYDPANPTLLETSSEIVIPLKAQDKTIGVLDIQSREPDAFPPSDVPTLEALADQVALAIENARLLTESQLVISQLETISSDNTRQNWKREKPGVNGLTALNPVEKNK